MEVHAIDTLSGREEPLEIDGDATVSAMKRQCGEAFGFGEDVELSVGGQRVACDGAERVSNVAAFSGGCRVQVVRGVAEFVAQLRSGAVKMDNIPAWARQRRGCVLAVLAHALERKAVARRGNRERPRPIQPYWVHPSLHDDKEVMLQFVRCDPQAFLRASAALRADADVVIAALQQDASMWHHVEDKSLQEQRSVALVAVPYCANSAVWLSDKAFVLEALENSEVMWTDVSKALQQDNEVVMKAFDCDKLEGFHQLSAMLQQDKEVVMKALDCDKLEGFHHLSSTLRQDKEVVMKVLDCDMLNGFHQLSETLQQDKEVVMRAFQHVEVNVSDLSATLQRDKEVVMEALDTRKLEGFHQLSATLQQDKEVVMRAFQHVAVNFGELSETLQQDKEVVMEALDTRKLEGFHQLSATLQQDKEVVMKALRRVAVNFGDLSETLQQDREVFMEALNYGKVRDFHQLSATLQQDKEVVMLVLGHCKLNEFHQLSATLQQDKEVVMEALGHVAVNFGDLSEALQQDQEVVMKALTTRAVTDFHQLSATLQQDKEFVAEVLRLRIVKFGDLSEALRSDKAFALQAVARASHIYTFITGPLRQDKDVALAAIAERPSLFRSMDPALRDDLEVALAAIRADPCNFIYAGDSVCADKQAALAAFPCPSKPDRPVLLPFASAELQADREVVLAAVRVNTQNADYASPALQDLVASGPWGAMPSRLGCDLLADFPFT